MARTAPTYSSIRSMGASHGTENRPSMFCLIWVPRPSPNRPPDRACKSQAAMAVTIGLRGKATTTAVDTRRLVVWSRAKPASSIPSCTVSATRSPS